MSLTFLLLSCASSTSVPLESIPSANTTEAACDSPASTTDSSAVQPEDDALDDYSPVVIQTSPQAGDNAVDPSLPEIRITFSKDMIDQSWSWV